MLKCDIRCSKRDCRYCYIPDYYRSNPDVLGTCECPAMVIETDIFTGQCLNFKSKDDSEQETES